MPDLGMGYSDAPEVLAGSLRRQLGPRNAARLAGLLAEKDG